MKDSIEKITQYFLREMKQIRQAPIKPAKKLRQYAALEEEVVARAEKLPFTK